MGRTRKEQSPMKKKKAKDPNKPKRAITGYFYYLQHLREDRKSRGLSIRPGDIAKEAGDNWSNKLPEDKKRPFLDQAVKDKERYDREMSQYGGKGGKKNRDPNKPKKPATAFFLFLADFRVKMKDCGLLHKTINSEAGIEWGKMSDALKAPYQKHNGELKVKYDAAMAKYQAEAAAAASKNGADSEEDEEMEEEDEEESDE